MSALIEIRGVTKTYRRGRESIEVLHGIDLDIERADFVALMGPSGSGKTTLLNLIGGLDTPTAGTITVDGRRIDNLSGGELARWRAAHVGFVFQFYNLLPVLSAQRNVELPLLLTSLSAAERRRRAEIALTLVGLRERTAHEIMLLLQLLNRQHGKTIVMVTHDPKAAEYAQRSLHLDKGTLAPADGLAR
jgi:putative ABC transport system ATP-binding protein